MLSLPFMPKTTPVGPTMVPEVKDVGPTVVPAVGYATDFTRVTTLCMIGLVVVGVTVVILSLMQKRRMFSAYEDIDDWGKPERREPRRRFDMLEYERDRVKNANLQQEVSRLSRIITAQTWAIEQLSICVDQAVDSINGEESRKYAGERKEKIITELTEIQARNA